MRAPWTHLLIGEAHGNFPLWGRNTLFPGLALIWDFFLFWIGRRFGGYGIDLPINAIVFTSPCAVEIRLLLRPLRKGRRFPAPNVVARIAGVLASATGVEPRWVFKNWASLCWAPYHHLERARLLLFHSLAELTAWNLGTSTCLLQNLETELIKSLKLRIVSHCCLDLHFFEVKLFHWFVNYW